MTFPLHCIYTCRKCIISIYNYTSGDIIRIKVSDIGNVPAPYWLTCLVNLDKTTPATCTESFLPPFFQLAVIISNISPMFLPGEPETTKQQKAKQQNFSTDPTLSTYAAGKDSLIIGHIVCSVTCSKCVWHYVCVLQQHIQETQLFWSICLGSKPTAQHSQRANEISQLTDVTLGPLQCVFISISLYHPSRHIVLSLCESQSLLSDGSKQVKCEIC